MQQRPESSIYKSLLIAFSILIMHVFMLLGVSVLVLFVYGMINNIGWVLLGVSLLLAGGGLWIYRRTKRDGIAIKDAIGDSLMKGRSVEVSFLGGMATFKISDNRDADSPSTRKITMDVPAESLTELARLYEKRLISQEEFVEAKKKIFK
jgi:LPXTG-motif cell wall-anchored protein